MGFWSYRFSSSKFPISVRLGAQGPRVQATLVAAPQVGERTDNIYGEAPTPTPSTLIYSEIQVCSILLTHWPRRDRAGCRPDYT